LKKFPLAIFFLLIPFALVAAPKKAKGDNAKQQKSEFTLFERVLDREKGDQIPTVHVFIQEQELILDIDGETAVISPVSTGRKKGWTPVGEYSIIGKSANHRSNTYGKHVSKSGKVVRSSVDSRKSTPPQGGRFVGSPMPNFLRMTNNGIGIHAGVLPGYPASHGCIRVPKEVSKVLFEKCPIGTKVFVWNNKSEQPGQT